MNAEQIIKRIDRGKFAAIAEKWGGVTDDENRGKYLDLDLWIETNLRRMRRAGLDTGPRRRVIDLGCGCGYFVYLCRLYGHDAVGIDMHQQRSLYTDIRSVLGVEIVPHVIQPFTPLPDLGAFDVATAHMITFNGHRVKPWGAGEWLYLLDDLDTPVTCLELNREPDGTLYPPGVQRLFESRGGVIKDHKVLIDRRRP